VPIGNYARQVFAKASGAGGIASDFSGKALANLKSDETNVRAVLAKVQLGEADAGVVYATDAAAAGDDVKQVPIPPQYNVVAEYPVAVLRGSKRPAVADAFAAFLLSGAGQGILQQLGFRGPG
jgi:molybdate transport system substrate-binding protein